MSVIQRAKELIETVGADEAIRVFETQIKELEDSNSFEDACRIAGWETAIDFIYKQKHAEHPLYSDIETLIVRWELEGDETAGQLTRKIIDLIESKNEDN